MVHFAPDEELPPATKRVTASRRDERREEEPTKFGGGRRSGSRGSIGSIDGIGSSSRLIYPEGEHAYQQFSSIAENSLARWQCRRRAGCMLDALGALGHR